MSIENRPIVGALDERFVTGERPIRHTRGMAQKRGYSREYKPHGDTGKRYLLDEIPAGLWTEVRAKAKREGISIRALILSLLEKWVRLGTPGAT